MHKKILFILFLLGFIIFYKLTYAQIDEIKYTEKLIIKDNKPNYLIGSLAGIATDSDLNIYLFDRMQSNVIKLNKEGKYLDEIVRRGRGPGEINSIYSYYLEDDTIILADRQNQQIMLVNLKGKEIKSIFLHPNDMNFPMGIEHYSGDDYLFLFSVGPSQSLRRKEGVDKFFHVFNTKDGKRKYSFGESDEILNSLNYTKKSGAGLLTRTYIGSTTFLNHQSILFAPDVYDGIILKIVRKKYMNWSIDSLIHGKDWVRVPFEDFSFQDYQQSPKKYKTGRNIFRVSSLDGSAAGLLNTRSVGLYRLSNGNIIHFIVTEHGSGESFYHQLHLELFNSNLKFLGSKKVKKGDVGEIIWSVNWKDQYDNFYMSVENGRFNGAAIKFRVTSDNDK